MPFSFGSISLCPSTLPPTIADVVQAEPRILAPLCGPISLGSPASRIAALGRVLPCLILLVSIEHLSHSVMKQVVHNECFYKLEYSHWQPQWCQKCQRLTGHAFIWVSSAFHRDSKQSYYGVRAVVATHPLYFRYTSHIR